MNSALIDTFFQMVRIESESGNERVFISYLKDLFVQELKAECTIDDVGNLIVGVPGKNTSSNEPVLFGVHSDTVKPGKNIEPILEDGIVRSRGATVLGADDKAGIAELFEAIRTSQQHPPLEVIVSVGEEIGHIGSENLDTSLLASKMGFVIDSERLEDILIGAPSHMRMKAIITGKAAHAGLEPEKGISSIKAASHAISIVKEGWIDNETTVNVGMIQGGEVLNAVPERTTVRIECRSQSHDKCLNQSKLIKEVFDVTAKAAGAHVAFEMKLGTTAYRLPEGANVVEIAKRALRASGIEAVIRVSCGGSDATSYNEKDIETVVIGTGGRGAHTKEENIAVEDMEKAVDIIQHIFKELSQKV